MLKYRCFSCCCLCCCTSNYKIKNGEQRQLQQSTTTTSATECGSGAGSNETIFIILMKSARLYAFPKKKHKNKTKQKTFPPLTSSRCTVNSGSRRASLTPSRVPASHCSLMIGFNCEMLLNPPLPLRLLRRATPTTTALLK